MSKSRAELAALGAARHWTVRPLSQELINRMLSDEYDWNCQFNLEAVEAALNPPPPPAPPSEAEVHAQKVAELSEEFIAWAKLQKRPPDLFAFEDWAKQGEDAAEVKRIEGEVEKWLNAHEQDYIHSDSNRDALNKYLSDHSLSVTFANLETAFDALVKSGDLVVDNSPKAGFWRNGEWHPMKGQPKSHFAGQVDPSKAASGEKQITKRVSQQSASEFLRNLTESPSFHKKMDDSLL
jgi:hypothetical protein